MGEIRLQWWRDALALPPALRTGHPVADAVREAAHSHQLPADLLEALIDAPLPSAPRRRAARRRELCAISCGKRRRPVCARRPCRGLCPRAPMLTQAVPPPGQAYGLVRLLLGLPRMLAHGRVPLAKSQLEAAGLTAEDLLTGAGGRQDRGLLGDCSAQIRRNLDVARQYRGHIAAGARASPSFLWPWSSPICGLSSGRAARCCARKRELRR